jgi:hypothetical protein
VCGEGRGWRKKREERMKKGREREDEEIGVGEGECEVREGEVDGSEREGMKSVRGKRECA